MSTPIAQYKLPSRIEIGFDSEAKAAMADLKIKLDEVAKGLTTRDSHGVTGLLKAIQAVAANDSNGTVHHAENINFYEAKLRGGWVHSLDSYLSTPTINRETVNDVDYLSESVPEIQGMKARDIIIDELWPDKPLPQITQADMQLIFIKNLATTLIQRMHSMERFSTHDYEIGHSGGGMMAWDIIFDKGARRFGLVTALQKECIQVVVFFPCLNRIAVSQSQGFRQDIRGGKRFRTITENELGDFRAAMEVCYA